MQAEEGQSASERQVLVLYCRKRLLCFSACRALVGPVIALVAPSHSRSWLPANGLVAHSQRFFCTAPGGNQVQYGVHVTDSHGCVSGGGHAWGTGVTGRGLAQPE